MTPSATVPASDASTPRAVVDRLVRPPMAEPSFWIIQLSVLLIVGLHYALDVHPLLAGAILPTGLPVAILVVPIGYAALRYGLPGSIGTTLWTMLLWLPDLLLPRNEGHAADDLLNFGVIVLVAVVFGRRVESERNSQALADAATARSLAIEAGYHRLFESTRAPIVVLDDRERVTDANPAAAELFGPAIGRSLDDIIGTPPNGSNLTGTVLTLPNGHDYRLDLVQMATEAGEQRQQLSFEDVTEVRSEERRTRQFARRIVEVEEDQRRRLARELHDEPLQLFLHLARRLEKMASTSGISAPVAAALAETRNQALDAATRLRTLARDLRPPALDQLGLVPALTSLVDDMNEHADLSVSFATKGAPRRLIPEVELGAFRIVQESLRNAQRHADASHVRVTLDFGPEELVIVVIDDGRGFDADAHAVNASTTNAMGIVGMRERARLLGGWVTIRAVSGAGTAVEASLPVLTPQGESTARQVWDGD